VAHQLLRYKTVASNRTPYNVRGLAEPIVNPTARCGYEHSHYFWSKKEFTMSTLRYFFPALVAGVALVASGCQDATTRDDVADAREDVQEEQEDVAEAQQEADEEMADAEQSRDTYAANKPVIDDDVADAQEEIKDQQQEADQAVADLRATEQQHQATQARDSFVQQSEKQLADLEARIKQLKERADATEGENATALNQQVEALENQHERAEEALEELKDAEVAEWQAHQEPVRTALNELSTSVNEVR
jgi:DNA repair exonuclease SbcCD ATPase subunit